MMYQQINPNSHQIYPTLNHHVNHHQNGAHQYTAQPVHQVHPSIEMQATAAPIQVQPQFIAQNGVLLQQQGQQMVQQVGYDQMNQVYTIQPQPVFYYPIVKQVKEIIGDFGVPMMINISCYLAAFAILITYIVACTLGHQQWFPCMITSAGTDYPENIFFRIGLLTNIFYWLIMLVFEAWWLKAQSQALMGVVKVSNWQNYCAFIGFFFYGLTIATIDEGYIPTHFHGGCAVIFFVFLCIYTQWNFHTVTQLRKLNPNYISKSSYDRKKIFAYAWILVLFFLICLLLKQKWGLAVAEWIGTYSIIFYLQTFATDLKGFTLSVDDTQFTKHDMKVQLARNLEEKHQKESMTQVTVASATSIQQQPQIYPVLQVAAAPQQIVKNTTHVVPKEEEIIQQQHTQSYFQAHHNQHKHHEVSGQVSQSHFQQGRMNPVNISESGSTADNSFMSIKKPFININGQY